MGTAAPAVTATTLPVGPAAELLPRLLTETGLLSEIIGSKGAKADQLLTVDNLYNAVRPEIEGADGVVALRFDGAIDLCRKAVQFNRPADADKCFRNLTALTENYLARNS